MNIAWLQELPTVLRDARRARRKPHPFVVILIFIAVFMAIDSLPGLLALAFDWGTDQLFIAMRVWGWVQPLLLATVFILLAVAGEGRSLRSMGIRARGALPDLAKGLLWGAAIYLGALLVAALGGTIEVVPTERVFDREFLGSVVKILLGGFALETARKGYLLVSLSGRMHIGSAIAFCACLPLLYYINVFFQYRELGIAFPYMELGNSLLLGLFSILYFLRTDNIWGVSAIASMRFLLTPSLLGIGFTGDNSALMNAGGDMLGGLAFTPVIVAAIALVAFMPVKEGRQTGGQSAPL